MKQEIIHTDQSEYATKYKTIWEPLNRVSHLLLLYNTFVHYDCMLIVKEKKGGLVCRVLTPNVEGRWFEMYGWPSVSLKWLSGYHVYLRHGTSVWWHI